jgi:glycosyltransferase involved in cell wall biosynthesis
MRLVFLTSRIPYPPEGGDRFRVYHLLRTAAEAGHEVHLLTFDTHARAAREVEPLRRIVASLEIVRQPVAVSRLSAARALPGTRPLQLAYYDSRRMAASAAALLGRINPDVVYTHLFRMAPYALSNQEALRARWVLDFTDVISDGILRSLPYRNAPSSWLYSEEGRRIRRYEREIAGRFDVCWVISDAEAARLAAIAPEARIEVVPNGVEQVEDRSGAARAPAKLLFFGFHRVFHNRDAVRFLVQEVVPLVRAEVPEASLDIAGKGAETLGRWARAGGVRNLGYLANPAEAMARSTVFVAPHRFAAGVQNKVIQALAHGLPVVTTPAVRLGLEPVPADVLRIGDSAEEIAAETVALLRDPEAAAAQAARGRAWVRRRFRWNASLRAFEAAASEPGAARSRGTRMAAAG